MPSSSIGFTKWLPLAKLFIDIFTEWHSDVVVTVWLNADISVRDMNVPSDLYWQKRKYAELPLLADAENVYDVLGVFAHSSLRYSTYVPV